LFFSSRRRHTRFSRDWSSDVCSSDLGHLYRGLFDEVGLGGEQREELLAYRGGAGGGVDVGEQPFEGRREQMGGAAEVPVEGGARDFRYAGDRFDGDRLDTAGGQQMGGRVEQPRSEERR